MIVPPLIRLPPTDMNVLYSSLMHILKISKKINKPGQLCVVTLDMQLYDMAMKLWCDVEQVSMNFLFRPGELHIIFWALATIGDYVEGSGLDRAWVESGMYSAATVNKQILKGKHMYRSLECHFVTLISCYSLLFQSYLQNHPDEQKLVDCMIDDIRDSFKGDTGLNTETKDDLNKLINKDSVFLDKLVGLSDRIALFKKDNTPMQTFMLNYIKQFETVLLFIRAARDRDINHHMKAL